MKKLRILLASLFLAQAFAFAGDGEYAVSRIPATLLKNANAVIRRDERVFELVNTHQTMLRRHYVITILNENAEDLAEFQEFYDKFNTIVSAEATLYDANGRQIRKAKKKDFEDRSAVSGLMDDGRYKRHNFYLRQFPYTVEYEWQVAGEGTLFFPSWTPQFQEALSVEQSYITIACPNDYTFRYKASHYEGEPQVVHLKNSNTSTWAIQALPAISKEPNSPGWQEIATQVVFGPTNFQMDSYRGNMATWQDFGKFIFLLRQGRETLPPAIKQTVHSLTDAVNSPLEKVKLLYKYMQAHTRYVNVSLGIGGWQPYDATYVAANGYGDCKALSNYMYSLLKEAGIPSYYTVIRAGQHAQQIAADFPSQQFNHVILCVPIKTDTIWLECTNQTLPAGYLSGFTANRFALLVDESGGKLVRTPKYGLTQNTQVRKVKANLNTDGTLHINAQTNYSALEQDEIHELINYFPKEKLREYLHQQLDFSTYDINDLRYEERPGFIPVIEEVLDITVTDYANITGKRVFINPNVMTRSSARPAADPKRTYDVLLRDESRQIDSIELELPVGYMAEAMPAPISLDSKFGRYRSSMKLMDNKLIYIRLMEQFSGQYPAADYEDYVKFLGTIFKADRTSLVLVKK